MRKAVVGILVEGVTECGEGRDWVGEIEVIGLGL